MTSKKRNRAVGFLLAASLTGAGILALSALPSDGDGPRRPSVIVGHAKEALPSSTAGDWVSYADHVAVVNVVSENEQPPSAEEVQAGEGYISRTVKIDVAQKLWSRPGAAELPASVTSTVDGWSFKGTTRTPIAREGASRLEPGHTYVIALARFADGQWSRIGSGAALPYDGAVVGNGEVMSKPVTTQKAPLSAMIEGPDLQTRAVAVVAKGQAASALAGVLAKATPDPVAVQNSGLDPVARYAKVTGQTAPTEYCAAAEPFDAASGSELSKTELADYLEVLLPYETEDHAATLTTLISYFRFEAPQTPATAAKFAAARVEFTVRLRQQCGFEVRSLTPNPAPDPTTPVG
ncbi:hypothetical protein DEJ50_00795 [Streptomyces venezuelae]|uniref:Uncharacterized protein n=1 Tax=Streptomyces venezuelae TaxID=54571 RepID=A0A5P2CVY2_STRVZ|nr:hypothetical protein [Streptomyces venezuelae]QES46603.1 hypothetical protein DEJ50_00795 [Streptomyces venezuelae]